MSIKSDLRILLCNELSDIYCHNCKNSCTQKCDTCHRKNMNWELSETAAAELVEKILNILE